MMKLYRFGSKRMLTSFVLEFYYYTYFTIDAYDKFKIDLGADFLTFS